MTLKIDQSHRFLDGEFFPAKRKNVGIAIRRRVCVVSRPPNATRAAISCCNICIYNVDGRFDSAEICQNGIDCESANVDCWFHGLDCELPIMSWVFPFDDWKNAFPKLQDHNCGYAARNRHQQDVHPGLRTSQRRSAVRNRPLEAHNFKIVNLQLAIAGFIWGLACLQSIASNHQSPRYGALFVRRGMQRSPGGRDPPSVRIQLRPLLAHAAEPNALRCNAGPRHPMLKHQRR